MHESGLISDLLQKVDTLAAAQQAQRIVAVQLQLGQFTAIQPEHLRDHFAWAAAGTRAAGARLDITQHGDPADPRAYALTLTGIEIEAPDPATPA
jgi:Zn finger protein HypA/HybF involved in hydrogenase expression